jgi:hypothetical protein
MKNRNETVLKMLRYRADVEDRSFLRVMMRQLTDSVIGHDRDTEGLIVDLLDNQITMQDMIVRSCGMMSMYADRLDMDSTRRLITYLEWRGDYRDSNYTGIVDMYGYVQTRWDDLADYVSHTAGETIARAFRSDYGASNPVSVCRLYWEYIHKSSTVYSFLARLVDVHGIYDSCDNWDARCEVSWIVADIMRDLE